MNKKVALIKCEDYTAKNLEKSISRILQLLELDTEIFRKPNNILLKPNLCLPAYVDKALTTHPEVIKAVYRLCNKFNRNISVGDSSIIGYSNNLLNSKAQTAEVIEKIEELGCSVSKLNGQKKKYTTNIAGDIAEYFISNEVLHSDFIINLPKLKTHSLMTLTCAVKNMYGIVPGGLKKKMHGKFPAANEFAELLVDIYQKAIPSLNIVDAIDVIEGNGPGMQGEKRHIGLLIASTDCVAIDSVVSKIIGLKPDMIPTNVSAYKRGLGNVEMTDIEVVGEKLEDWIFPDYKLPMTQKYNAALTKKMFDIKQMELCINEQKCSCCLKCYESCPVKAISLKESQPVIDMQKCVSCMTCHELCLDAAIDLVPSKFYSQLSKLKYKHKT